MKDPVLKFVVESAKTQDWIREIRLFGSRARGDYHERSDYDLAVIGNFDDRWPAWVLEIKEKAPTLCGIDIVQLTDDTAISLKEAVNAESKIIYERQTKK